MTNSEKVTELRISIQQMINQHVELTEHDSNTENFNYLEIAGVLEAVKVDILKDRETTFDDEDRDDDLLS